MLLNFKINAISDSGRVANARIGTTEQWASIEAAAKELQYQFHNHPQAAKFEMRKLASGGTIITVYTKQDIIITQLSTEKI